MNLSNLLGASSNVSKPYQSTQNAKPNTSHNIQGSLGPSIEEMQKMIDHMQAIIDQWKLNEQHANQHASQGMQYVNQNQNIYKGM